jgi:hypothetical protein
MCARPQRSTVATAERDLRIGQRPRRGQWVDVADGVAVISVESPPSVV